MACINVNSSVSDQFYRYKMPRLIAKVEGKGNGIKTVVVNMTDIAKALARPPTYPTKFFGCELGAQTQFDLKNDRYIVNGAHDANKLQGLLDGFIKKFVLCPECSNPETNLVILSKKQLILQRCIACGHQGPVDMNHKLTTFILKNPPDQDNAQTPSKGKKAKKSKKQEAVNGDRNSPEANAQEQMAAQRAIGGDILVPPEATDGDDDDWTEDVSEAAVRERMKVLTSAAKGLMLTDDLEKTQEERMNILYNLIKQKKDSDSLAGADKEIVAEAERLEVKEKCPMILVELLFDERILQQIKEHRVLFLRFCHNTPKAQKYLLGGIEILVGNVHKEALLSKVPHILKLLYDHDILDEEVILKWAEKPTKRYVSKLLAHEIRDSAKPFIKWLQEAEEEESDGEEEESEDEVQEIIYTSVAQVGQNKVKTQSVKEEDDIDIDAI